MRKLTLLSLIGVLTAILPANAALAAGMPRYSSIVQSDSAGFTVSFRNLTTTEYVTCTLPAPVKCGSPSSVLGDPDGSAVNEIGNLRVRKEPDASGNGTVLTALTLKKGNWEKAGSWMQAGSVSRILVANDGAHFVTVGLDGSTTLYDTAKKAAQGSGNVGTTGSALTLSSTGKYLAWYKPATLNGDGKRCYFVADVVTGKAVQTCDSVAYWDLVSEDNRVFAFSPDDKTLIFRSDRDGYQAPYRVRLASGLPKTLAPERVIVKPYQMADMVFIDNTHLAVVANRTAPTMWGLWNMDINNLTITQIADSVSYGVSLRRFGSYVSFARTTPTGVSAALYNVSSGSVTAIESLASTSIAAGTAIPAPTRVGKTTDGAGYAVWESPATGKATPIVIWLHGGPYRQISTSGYHPFASYGSFDWMLEQVRQSGATILKLDYPGSYGYGRTYAESLAGNVGVKDVAAVKDIISGLRGRYGASAPIYLIGNSYGGYLADKALVEMPSSIAGIYSISGVSGWEELVAGNPNTIFTAQFKNATAGAQDPAFAKAEVLLKADKIGSQKILLAHGDSDTSVAVSQTNTWDQVLKLAGKNVQATIYAGEDHVFTKQSDFVDLCKKAIGLVGGNPNGRCQL